MATPLQYPQTEGYAFDFHSGEVKLNGKIYTAFSNISHNQPLEEGIVPGKLRQPMARTAGRLNMGEGALEWSDLEEAMRFLDDLGDGWRDRTFTATCVYTAPGRASRRVVLASCRIIDEEFDESEGADAVPLVTPFSFMLRRINGRVPLLNMRG